MEDMQVLGGAGQGADDGAFLRRVGVAFGGKHHGERGAPVPLGLDPVETTVDGGIRAGPPGPISAAS